MWVFAYGSIIWRPSFTYLATQGALLRGWRRRFWQGSPDHRGTPVSPGRVVTLVEDRAGSCRGIGFQLEPADVPQILAALDIRESGGYVRLCVDIELDGGDITRALTYVAPPENANFLGPAPSEQILAQIRASEGASGNNVDYVLNLADALRRFDIFDEEVHALARELQNPADL